MFGASSESQRGSRFCSYAVTMRVLVVEDEERMASLLRRALEEEGHAVDVARDGPEGVWLATENPYGAVVLDLMLPGFDGFEVCRRLRAAWSLGPRPHVDGARRDRRSRAADLTRELTTTS